MEQTVSNGVGEVSGRSPSHWPSPRHTEGLLPDDPPASMYTCETTIDVEHKNDCEDELLITESAVIWSRGGLFRKTFKFDIEKESITQALLAYFPTSPEHDARSLQSR